jgi:cytochrome c551/c552
MERLMWTGKTPFEMKAVRAMSDGFEIEFTQAVNIATAENVSNYTTTSYTYKYHPVYGSPIIDVQEIAVRGAKASADGMRVRIVVDGLREGYVHDIKPEGVRSNVGNLPLLHPQAFYTLNAIPQGAKADIKLVDAVLKNVQVEDKGTLVNTPDNQMKEAAPSVESVEKKAKTVEKAKTKVVEKPKPVAPKPAVPAAPPVINEKEIQGLLAKHTCNACHKTNDKTVGPSFAEIAKRKYTVAKMAQLIAVPQPQNWPDFETPMAPMPHVPKKDVEKIATWINSLRK